MTPYYDNDEFGIAIHHGDCLAVLPTLPESSVDAVVTDSPYGIKLGAAFVRSNCTRVDDGHGAFNENQTWEWLEHCEYLRAGGNVACFAKRGDALPAPIREWHRYYLVKKSAPPTPRRVFVSMVEECLIGTKPGGKRGWWGTGWEPNRWIGQTPKQLNNGDQTGHPAEKPLEPIERLVRCLAPPGGVVLDPFLGSGTTAVACIRVGRKCVGIEEEEQYCAIAAERVEREIAEMRGMAPRRGLFA